MTRPRYYTDVPRTILWLIPGDEDSGVEPFYLGKFPVTNEQRRPTVHIESEPDDTNWSRWNINSYPLIVRSNWP